MSLREDRGAPPAVNCDVGSLCVLGGTTWHSLIHHFSLPWDDAGGIAHAGGNRRTCAVMTKRWRELGRDLIEAARVCVRLEANA